MKAACHLGVAVALAIPSYSADMTSLADKASKAAAELPQGCIVIAEQKADAIPVFSLHGHGEPAGIPPEKRIFEIGSISKVFTGMLLAQAILEKKVTLQTTLRDLMGPQQTFADDKVAGITLSQLATHTSGLPRLPEDLMKHMNLADPYASYDRARLNACIAKANLPHAAPFESVYSNLGVGLLGDLMSRLYGKDWETLVVERIAKPLGMTDTCMSLSDEQTRRLAPPYTGSQAGSRWHFKSLAGGGALLSTASDIIRLGQALARPETSPLREAIELTEQPQAGTIYGLCLVINQRKDGTEYWYQGATGGYGSWISARPATREVVVMLINNSSLLPQDVIFGKAPATRALADYVGSYDTGFDAGGTHILYVFEARGANLWMQITGQPFVPLSRHPTGKDRFVFKPVNAAIQFTREKGEVVSTTLFQAGQEIKATKMATGEKKKP